jgi:ABC-type Mn2+/Zn2+ transport system ATPase subunit
MSGRPALVQLAAARSARQRAYRARKHEGRITLPVEVDEVALTAALIEAGLLRPAEQEDRRKLAEALARVIEIITAEALLRKASVKESACSRP